MVYARGPKAGVQFGEAFNVHCARVGYEVGADVVKVQHTGSPDSFSRVVGSVPIPVLIAGGPRMGGDREVLQMVEGSLRAGGAGVCIGRNVFGAEDVPGLCRALAGIVHEGPTVEDAVDLIRSNRRDRSCPVPN